MKNLLKLTIIMLLTQSIFIGQTFASSRVDYIVEMERRDQIRDLLNGIYDLGDQRRDLLNIETHLKRTKKGQSIYLKVETVVGSVIAVGIVIGSYKAYFPPGFRAMLSGYITATAISRGLIKLSDKEVTLLLKQISDLNKKINVLEETMTNQMNDACNSISYYALCSYE